MARKTNVLSLVGIVALSAAVVLVTAACSIPGTAATPTKTPTTSNTSTSGSTGGSGGGSGTTAGTSPAKYLYVANNSSPTGTGGLSTFDLSSGVPTAASGSPYNTGANGYPLDVVAGALDKYLYLTDEGAYTGAGGLSVYSLASGVATKLSGSPYATGSAGCPWGMAVSPGGGYLYVTNKCSANGTGGLSVYSLSNGVPTALSGSPYTTGALGLPVNAVVSPDGKYLYVTNFGTTNGADGLSAYSLSNGVPTALSGGATVSTGSSGQPDGLAVGPNGKYLYVTNNGSSTGAGGLSAYSLSNGVPTALSGSPYATGTKGSPKGVAVGPKGDYLYVVNNGSSAGAGGLSVYSLSNGVPTALSGSPFATGAKPWAVKVSPNGNYLYVTNSGSTSGTGGLSVYSLSNGVPTALSGSPYSTGSAGIPYGVALGS